MVTSARQHFPKSFYGYFYLGPGVVKCSGGARTYYNFIGKLFPGYAAQTHIRDSANHCRSVRGFRPFSATDRTATDMLHVTRSETKK
jgi:hypothetical protein